MSAAHPQQKQSTPNANSQSLSVTVSVLSEDAANEVVCRAAADREACQKFVDRLHR